jgi:hypothetical protein
MDVEHLALRGSRSRKPRLEGLHEMRQRHGGALDVPAGRPGVAMPAGSASRVWGPEGFEHEHEVQGGIALERRSTARGQEIVEGALLEMRRTFGTP